MKNNLSLLCLLLIICVSISFSDVDLVSFAGTADSQKVTLRWITATEVNNYGFNIERRDSGGVSWDSIGFAAGYGTSSSPHEYTYIDSSLSSSLYYYRLKQVNNDKSFNYSLPVEVVLITDVNETTNVIHNFALSTNYPNPFNPSTTINYQLPKQSHVTMKIFDVLGRELVTLVNGVEESGYKSVNFDASELPSGVYFYRVQAGSFVQTNKMVLMK
jgi:hypothetical protein